jgi:glutamyl-tRNA synthetase
MYKNVRVRFAPSPTGHLHIGGLRSAIFNWLFAKHNNGVFLIRIEDTDKGRSTEEYESSIVNSFKWMGIQSDEPILKQSSRIVEHKELIDKLLVMGKAYRCFCTKKLDVDHNDYESGGYSKYDRGCLDRQVSEQDLEKPFVIRFKLPDFDSDIFKFKDLIYGDITFPIDQFDDFIIARSDGDPVYNFVVVADDIYQRVNFVIRGQDHLINTPKQIMLYEALGVEVPQFAHLPLILGSSGAKLSKREAAVSVLSYMKEGYLPDALFNYLVRLGWSYGDQEVFSRDELVKLFDLNSINKSGAIFDIQKLQWLNALYIREMADKEILQYIINWIDSDFEKKLFEWSNNQILSFISLYKERVKTLSELIDILVSLHQVPVAFNDEDLKQWRNPETIEHLKMVEKEFNNLVAWNIESITSLLKGLTKTLNIKLPMLAKPIRLAITGKLDSPSIFELVFLLSKDESLKRIARFREHLSD